MKKILMFASLLTVFVLYAVGFGWVITLGWNDLVVPYITWAKSVTLFEMFGVVCFIDVAGVLIWMSGQIGRYDYSVYVMQGADPDHDDYDQDYIDDYNEDDCDCDGGCSCNCDADEGDHDDDDQDYIDDYNEDEGDHEPKPKADATEPKADATEPKADAKTETTQEVQ